MFLLINKPKGITSHDVIDELRKITGIRKIGHAGTLDPNATGLLIVGIGRESTKKLGNIAKNTTKQYKAEIRLGIEKDTDDAEGKTIHKTEIETEIETEEIIKTLDGLTGKQEQMPPLFSAIKVDGKKAYVLARKGKSISLSPRKITIHSINLIDYSYPVLHIACHVSSGTYIRSLARDIGKKLGCGAYLKNLKRIKIGDYNIVNATKLKDLNSENWKSSSFTL